MKLFSILLFFGAWPVIAQQSEEEIQQLREEHLLELTDTAQHVLNAEEIEHFQGLNYFDFNADFQITATFTKKKGKKFEMVTSTDRRPVYRRYGYVDFEVNGTACRLEVYQNMELRKSEEYANYLFIPFRDATSSHATYGGGRFMDVEIPEGDELLLDFNLAYNPYCAYSYRYSCPVPPKANTLSVAINAGEKTPTGH